MYMHVLFHMHLLCLFVGVSLEACMFMSIHLYPGVQLPVYVFVNACAPVCLCLIN